MREDSLPDYKLAASEQGFLFMELVNGFQRNGMLISGLGYITQDKNQ